MQYALYNHNIDPEGYVRIISQLGGYVIRLMEERDEALDLEDKVKVATLDDVIENLEMLLPFKVTKHRWHRAVEGLYEREFDFGITPGGMHITNKFGTLVCGDCDYAVVKEDTKKGS